MKALLTITAILEAVLGAVLLVAPSAPASILLGAPLDSPVPVAVARIAGAALLSLGVACWAARREAASAARGIIAAMLVYHSVVVGVLVYAALGTGLAGPGLWPAAALHTGLGLWCLACLTPRNARLDPRPLDKTPAHRGVADATLPRSPSAADDSSRTTP